MEPETLTLDAVLKAINRALMQTGETPSLVEMTESRWRELRDDAIRHGIQIDPTLPPSSLFIGGVAIRVVPDGA